jgi:hypothetical protein
MLQPRLVAWHPTLLLHCSLAFFHRGSPLTRSDLPADAHPIFGLANRVLSSACQKVATFWRQCNGDRLQTGNVSLQS